MIEQTNMIDHPSHYCFGKYEPVKVIQDWGLNFCLGNVIKYVARAGKKEDNSMIQDLEKAKKYIEFEIESLKRE
uniref:Nucelotide kinase n=1 Tax=Dulem virus 39 TaxID=3145757 RepID=A0AAU8B659_9CAUD